MKNTATCYLEKDGKYLMIHRTKKKNDANAGKYIGVGGHFEEGESPEDCICREVLEETGLTLLSLSYRGIVTFVSDQWETEYVHVFTSNRFEGNLHPCDEGELRWIERKKLFDYPMWEGDAVFLRLIEKNAPFFSLKLTYEGDVLKNAVLNREVISPDTGV
ncbi:MAG: 8-oxo-dGTP diphosphatase [Clostridia bacterium]|nr:8-oxo-dGTP diphosphatase [Clostridia bacterium]